MIRIPNLHTVNTAIEADSAALEAVLRTGAPAIENAPATPELVDKRSSEIDAVSRHSRLVLQAAARRQKYRAQSSLDQVTVLLQDARERESALAVELERTPSGSLIGGAILIVAAGLLLVVEYFLVVSVVPPALGLRPGSLSAMAMAGVAPLAMVALEPFVDQLLVTPFMRRRAFGRPARAFLALMIVLVGIAVVVIAIRVVTVNAELRQQYSQVVGDLLKHKQSELSSATVRASVLAIGVLALIAAPLLCSFGYQSMTGGYQRWKLLRQQHDMRQLALAANLRIADGRSHIALLEEGDAAREEAESVESLVRARALRGLAERAAIGEVKAAITETPRSETTSSETRSETPPQVVSIDTPRPRGDRQLYEQILRWRREVLDADIRKAS